MATETAINVGIRRNFNLTLGDRNFEDVDGTVLYLCNHEGLCFQGTTYHVGDALPFDTGGISYSVDAIEELRGYWNHGWISPAI